MKTVNFTQLSILVSETGWPSAGDSEEIGPSIANAQAYNRNFFKCVYNQNGTPQKPLDVSSAYVYELFNEESRSGPLRERSWGLFSFNMTPAYPIDLTGIGQAVVGNSANMTWCVVKSRISESAALQQVGKAAMPASTTAVGGVDFVEPQSLKKLALKSLKRAYDLFAASHADRIPSNPDSRNVRIQCKIRAEYDVVKDLPGLPPRESHSAGPASNGGDNLQLPTPSQPTPAGPSTQRDSTETGANLQVVPVPRLQPSAAPGPSPSGDGKPIAGAITERYQPSAAVMKRLPSKWPKPAWHPPWINYRVISGHLGWVRSIAFDPGNEWFCTGSADRTIKIWETATGKLRLTLTGHIEQIRGLAVSPRHPYLFSAGDDKQVKCWDLEYNKVIRSYHGHLSGVYCLALHPTLDILMTGGRDSVCRVWDMRTKAQIFALSGHENTVCSIITQATDPQVVTGSHDTTIKLWDLAAVNVNSYISQKSVRALAMHPFEHTFASASADNIKKFRLPKGEFLHNMLSQQRTIVNCMAINEDNVLCSAGDNGSMWFWDWKSGHNFQQAHTVVQPGSLDSEAGIYALSYDVTGSRLITCEADKTIKMWKEDEKATPETHPINFKPPKEMRRF